MGSNPIDNNQSKQDIAARNSAGFSPFNIFPRIIPSEIHDDDKGTSSDSKRNDINDQKWNDVSGGDESDTDDDVVELKDVHNYAGAHSAATRVIAYFISKKSPNCLWPVMMLQCQVNNHHLYLRSCSSLFHDYITYLVLPILFFSFLAHTPKARLHVVLPFDLRFRLSFTSFSSVSSGRYLWARSFGSGGSETLTFSDCAANR